MSRLGMVLFLSGIFLALALALAAIWADFEGFSYFNSGAGYPQFNGLVCPVLMTPSEKSIVAVNFKNPDSEAIEPYYEVSVSGLVSSHDFEGQLSVPAHSTKTVKWTVDASDIDLGFFVFVDLQVLPVAGFSTRETTCGIMVVDVPGLDGGQILTLVLAASLLGIILGLILWEKNTDLNSNRYENLHHALQTLGVLALLALPTSLLLRWWAAGLLLCVLEILLLVIILRLELEARG